MCIPEDIRDTASLVFQDIAERFLRYASAVGSPPKEDPEALSYSLLIFYDELHSLEEYLEVFSADMDRLFLKKVQFTNSFITDGFWEICTEPSASYSELLSIHDYFAAQHYQMGLQSDRDRKREEAMVVAFQWLHGVAQMNDGFCQLICNAFTIAVLVGIMNNCMRLSRAVTRALHNLLITLMASQSFKLVVAVAYTRSYGCMARLFGDGYGIAGNSLFNIAVQFLNRDWVVNELAFHHQYLQQTMGALSSMLHTIRLDEDLSRSGVVAKRRYNPIVGDMKVSLESSSKWSFPPDLLLRLRWCSAASRALRACF